SLVSTSSPLLGVSFRGFVVPPSRMACPRESYLARGVRLAFRSVSPPLFAGFRGRTGCFSWVRTPRARYDWLRPGHTGGSHHSSHGCVARARAFPARPKVIRPRWGEACGDGCVSVCVTDPHKLAG